MMLPKLIRIVCSWLPFCFVVLIFLPAVFSSGDVVFQRETLNALARDDVSAIKACLMKEPTGFHTASDVCIHKGVIKKGATGAPRKYFVQNSDGSFTAARCPPGQTFSFHRCNCVVKDAGDEHGDNDDADDVGGQFDNEKVNAKNGTGCSLIFIAACHGSVRVVRFLLDNGADAFIENDHKETPLHCAAFYNHPNVIEAFFDKFGDKARRRRLVNARQRLGQTPFFYAIKGSALPAASKLLEYGAVFAASDNEKQQPIHWAVAHDRRDVVEFLVRIGALLNSTCCFSRKKTAFHIAAEHNSHHTFAGQLGELLHRFAEHHGQELMCIAATNNSIDVAKLLLRGHSALAHDCHCRYACVGRIGRPIHLATYYRHLEFVEFLLQRAGMDINAVDSFGTTPLMDAVQKSAVSIVSLLLEHNAKVDVRDSLGRTTFLVAAAQSSIVLAKMLLARHANPFVADKKGFTALHLTNETAFLEFVLQINHANQHINAKTVKTSGSLTPLHVAIFEERSFEFIHILLTHGADPFLVDDFHKYTAIHAAVEVGCQIRLLDMMLKKATCADQLHLRDRFGRSIFHLAISKNHLDIAKRLLNVKGASFSINELVEKSGETALHIAARQGLFDAVKFLTERSCDTAIISSIEKRTALLEALYWRNFNLLELLLKNSHDLLIRDASGMNALHLACLHGQPNLVKQFIRKTHEIGLDQALMDSTDGHGDTALHYAVRANDVELIVLLLEKGADCTKLNNAGRSPVHLAVNLKFLYLLKTLSHSGNCDLSQPDSSGRLPLEYEQIKSNTLFIESLLRDVGTDCCEGVSLRFTLALKLGLRSLAALMLLENKQCDLQQLFIAEHPFGLSALTCVLMTRDIELIPLAFEVGAFKPNSRFGCSAKIGEIRHESSEENSDGDSNDDDDGRDRDGELSLSEMSEADRQHFAEELMKQLLFGTAAKRIYLVIEAMQVQLEEGSKCVETDVFFDVDKDEGTATVEDDSRIKTAMLYLFERTSLDINFVDKSGNTLLHYLAVGGCNLAGTAVLLKKGANPNKLNEAGFTPLHIAALSKSKCAGWFADLLLRYGAVGDLASSITISDGDTMLTPVHLASSRCGNVLVIEAFIGLNLRRRRRNLNFDDVELESPNELDYLETTTPAITSTRSGESLTSKLSQHDNDNESPIWTSTTMPEPILVSSSSSTTLQPDEGNATTVEYQENGALRQSVLNRPTKFGKTASWFALESNRFDILERLHMAGGADFSIFRSSALKRSRVGRNIQQTPDAFTTCRYFVEQCEQQINTLTSSSGTCSDQLTNFKKLEENSLSLIRKSVAYSSEIVHLDGGRKKFYFLVEDSKNTEDAESACLSRGGTLAQFSTNPERDAIQKIEHPQMPSLMWIGLRRGTVNNGAFWWSDGIALKKSEKVEGAQDVSCAALTIQSAEGSKIKAHECGDMVDATLCQIEIPQPEYWIVTGSFTWQQALQACSANASTRPDYQVGLAMPKQLFKLEQVLQLDGWPERQSGWQGCWIGLSRTENENSVGEIPKFQWNDGSYMEPPDRLPWLPGQPAEIGGPDDCVELFSSSHREPGRAGKLSDMPCDFRLNCAVCFRHLQ